MRIKRTTWVLVPVLLMASSMAAADWTKAKIVAPAPTRDDFIKAVEKANAVDDEHAFAPQKHERRARGKTAVKKDGVIHQQTGILVDIPFKTFMKRMDPADWSLNLPQRWGGEVNRIEDGPTRFRPRRVLQQERMVLGFPRLDMTKNTVVYQTPSSARIYWNVTSSNPTGHKSVHRDDGWIEFSSKGGKTLITARSAHVISPKILTAGITRFMEKKAPKVVRWLSSRSLGRYFKRALRRYQQIGEGRPARRLK